MNFGEMTSLIADDLIDERLTNVQIQNAINQALRFYSRKTFYFNTIKDVTDIVVGQEYYEVTNSDIFIADLYTLQTVKFIPNDTNIQGWPLTVKSDAAIENMPTNVITQRSPIYYAYAQMQLRFYPKPQTAGKVNIIATYMYPKLDSDTDTNPFMERADELIRQAAKRYISFNVLHDQALGDRCAAMESEEFASLRAETLAREPVEPMEAASDLVALSYQTDMYDVVNDR